MIATAEALHDFLPLLAPHDRVGLDTEADSLHCYFEKLCLVQLSLPGHDTLIDPLAGFSLAPLYDALKDKELILQGADFDLRLLRRAGGMEAERVFDTVIAARLTGKLEFSLAALVSQYFGITLAKSSQKENWARRPLTEKMSAYAINDTRFSPPARGKTGRRNPRARPLGMVRAIVRESRAGLENHARTRHRKPLAHHRQHRAAGPRLRAPARALDLARRRGKGWGPPGLPCAAQRGIARRRAPPRRRRARFVPSFFAGAHEAVPGRRRSRARPASKRMAGDRAQAPHAPHARGGKALPRSQEKARCRRAEQKLDPSLIAPKATLEALAADPASVEERLLPWQRALIGSF